MVQLLTQPPPQEAIATMLAIDGVRVAPALLATQRGPDGHLGPEEAGAVLILQATFADEGRAAEFWMTAAGLMQLLATAPGFIRRYNFTDGPHYTLIALWRTAADADAFYASDEHRQAMRAMGRNRWQYTHFAGLWEMTPARRRQRQLFCQQCEGVMSASETLCSGCGTELYDP